MGLVDPLLGVLASLCFLIVLLYRRVNLGITLNATALLLAMIALDWQAIPTLVYETTSDPLTFSVVLATFGIMFLSQLYKETGLIMKLSESLSRIIRNPKIVIATLPAIIGFLPVAGGALMSAPLVKSEADKLEIRPEKEAYLNIWFRHTVFPVYPLSQVLIITVALTGTTLLSIVVRQIPVVAVMIVIGFLVGFWKVGSSERVPKLDNSVNNDFRVFLASFSPILMTIIVAIILGASGFGFSQQGFEVLIAVAIGLLTLMIISRPTLKVLFKPIKSWGVYGVTAAAYGAFLLRNVMTAIGISSIFEPLVTGETVSTIFLLTLVPAALGFLTGSPSGGVALSVSIFASILNFSVSTTSLIYMSAYLGYVMAPTHLCFVFTADYFKSSLGRIYKYLLPSILLSFGAVLLIYLIF